MGIGPAAVYPVPVSNGAVSPVRSSDLLGEPMRFVVQYGRRYCLSVFSLGLACCAVEVVAAGLGSYDPVRAGSMPFAASPERADVLVIAGTVTDKIAPAVLRAYQQLPEPRYVISFGACANCGGPYWDSYSVTKGVDQLIAVDVYVPGCPPRPEALLHGIARLHELIARRQPPAADSPRDAASLSAGPVRPGAGKPG